MKILLSSLCVLCISCVYLNAQQLMGTTNKIVIVNPTSVINQSTNQTDVVKFSAPIVKASAAPAEMLGMVDIISVPILNSIGATSENYKWAQELDSIIKLKYRKFLDQFVSPHSMAYDALKALKEKEERYGLTKEIKDEYIYWYKAIRDDVKANYNIDLSK